LLIAEDGERTNLNVTDAFRIAWRRLFAKLVTPAANRFWCQLGIPPATFRDTPHSPIHTAINTISGQERDEWRLSLYPRLVALLDGVLKAYEDLVLDAAGR